jgi:thioredoxin reductase (NADPH)
LTFICFLSHSILEFDRLLRKHATETGLPVVVDFYSDSCGPCRMMAPIFKTVAASFTDKAVFVKIDTNRQPELSSRYNVRSLPTFSYFMDGKKVDQAVGGIGEAALRQQTEKLIRQAELENTLLTLESLVTFYQAHDATKSSVDIGSVHHKCAAMLKGSMGDCVGAAANQLARRLRKKYGAAPVLQPRFNGTTTTSSSSSSSSSSGSSSTKAPNRSSGEPQRTTTTAQPNLHLASVDDLQAELERRLDEIRDQTVDAEDADEEETDPNFGRWPGPNEWPQALVIVGGGPAGLAAAIYGARAGLRPLVIAPSMGGQLQGKGVEVENYPGLFNQTGPSVVAAMRLQAASFGAVFEDDVVNAVLVDRDPAREYSGGKPKPISIVTNNTGTIETHALIVATGAEANWLGVAGEWELRGGGVSSCAVCDGFLYAGKHVVVVGGGDAAMEDALVLARTSRSVTVVHRRDQFRASKVLANRVLDHPLITVVWNVVVQEILGQTVEPSSSSAGHDEETVDMDNVEKTVSGVVLRDVKTNETRQIATDAVFVAIGHTPNTPFLQNVVEFDPTHPGYVKVAQGSTQTTVKGIFAAGDVSDAVYRQAVTSAGSGAAAALDAERYLSEHGLGNEAAELEAELMADLLNAQNSRPQSDADAYNVYDDVGGKMEGMKESMAAEL